MDVNKHFVCIYLQDQKFSSIEEGNLLSSYMFH